MSDKRIEVTCVGADELNINDFEDFQGDIKRISPENMDKLTRRIKKHGINAPVFIWKDKGLNYILDGHQRLKALRKLQEEGFEIPLIPVAIIEAKSKKDAKEKLLGIASQYGEFDIHELDVFMEDIAGQDIMLAGEELDLKRMFPDGYGSEMEVTEKDVMDAASDVLCTVQTHEVKMGHLKFHVPHKEFALWYENLKKESGFEYTEIITGLKGRLGFE